MRRLATDYINDMTTATGLLRVEEIEAGCRLLADSHAHGRGVYICGNGGSASTASHLAVDLGKNVCGDDGRGVRVVSLTDNVPWLTALSNDDGYDDCFAGQLRVFLEPDDLVIGISASGDSENLVRAFELARQRGAHRLALIGFDGGRLARLATKRIWVDSYDYGIVESVHLLVAHAFVRMLAEGGSLVEKGRVETRSREQRVDATGTCRASDIPLIPTTAPGPTGFAEREA